MKSILRLLLGIICTLSIVIAWEIDLSAEIIRGEVKQTAAEAQLFSLRANDGRVLLVAWDQKTTFRNLKNPAAIKVDDYLIVDLTLQEEQKIAVSVTVPEIILPPGIRETSFDMLDKLAAGAAAGKSFTLIDTRPSEKYEAGHIPGAISIPLARISKRTAGLLPGDRNAAVVFYDDGAEVDAAVKAAEMSGNNGYTNVLLFREGVRGWVKSGRLLACSPTYIRKSKPALFDLRSADKVQQGHIAGAVNYPLPELAGMYAKFPAYRQTSIVVYGESDRDALAGAAIIKKWGYKNVTFFQGGVSAWLDSAEALESGPAADHIYAGEAGHRGELQPKDFEMALISPQSVELVDVRSDADYRKGNLQKGVHIPLQSLSLRYKELSREKIQVVFAGDAERAEMAYDFLKAKGFRVNYFGGSVDFGKNGEYKVKVK